MKLMGYPQAARMVQMTAALLRGQTVTTKWIMATFGVSLATAKRDMLTLATAMPEDAITEELQPVLPGAGATARRILRATTKDTPRG